MSTISKSDTQTHEEFAEEVAKWFSQSHVTITFTTVSGSRYTLVKRPKVSVLIKDNTGEAWKSAGAGVVVTPSGVIFGSPTKTWHTTQVQSFYVLSN